MSFRTVRDHYVLTFSGGSFVPNSFSPLRKGLKQMWLSFVEAIALREAILSFLILLTELDHVVKVIASTK